METNKMAEHILSRQERLRTALGERRLAWLLVSNPSNIFYLTGYRGSAGLLLIGPEGACLWVNRLNAVQAAEEACGVRVQEVHGALFKAVGRWLKSNRVRALGYEERHLTCESWEKLRGELDGAVRLRAVGPLIEQLRMVKDESELERIRAAGRATVTALKQVLPQVRPGLREVDLAAELEYRMRREGADGPAFETIVASGCRGALPHARASAKLLKKDELVILDIGAILGGYAVDITRTFFLGRPSRVVQQMYRAVEEAQAEALFALRAGVKAGQVDAIARQTLRKRGMANYFVHSTGHGVGIDVHEEPHLARGATTPLQVGCVVTVEPGVYIKGRGGVRVEDTVSIGAEKPEVLTPFPKDDWIIP